MNNDIYQNSRSKIGKWMYATTNNLAQKLSKHKWLYYVLMYSWGGIMSLIGVIVSLILIICLKSPQSYNGTWYFKVSRSRGGVSLGSCFVRDENSIDSINKHEFGHTYQNAIFGPFFIFIIAIPSFIRYWYQVINTKKGKQNKSYDLIWFEGSATTIGSYITKKEGK